VRAFPEPTAVGLIMLAGTAGTGSDRLSHYGNTTPLAHPSHPARDSPPRRSSGSRLRGQLHMTRSPLQWPSSWRPVPGYVLAIRQVDKFGGTQGRWQCWVARWLAALLIIAE